MASWELTIQFCVSLVHIPASCWDVHSRISGFAVSGPGRSGNMLGSPGVAVTLISTSELPSPCLSHFPYPSSFVLGTLGSHPRNNMESVPTFAKQSWARSFPPLPLRQDLTATSLVPGPGMDTRVAGWRAERRKTFPWGGGFDLLGGAT